MHFEIESATRNLRDFPHDALSRYDISAQHPDEFILYLIDEAPDIVLDAVKRQQASLVNPPVPMEDLLALFERLDLIKTATALRHLLGGDML